MKKPAEGYLSVMRTILMVLPGVTEGTSYRTPSFSVRKKFMTRLLNEVTIAVYTPDRDEWTEKDPNVFFVTPHYYNHPYVLVDLSKVKKADLTSILKAAWAARAGKA